MAAAPAKAALQKKSAHAHGIGVRHGEEEIALCQCGIQIAADNARPDARHAVVFINLDRIEP